MLGEARPETGTVGSPMRSTRPAELSASFSPAVIPRSVYGIATRALLLLGVCGASMALYAQQAWAHLGRPFSETNALSFADRNLLFASMIAAAVLAGVAGLTFVFVRGVSSVDSLLRFAHLVSPLCLLGPLPAVLDTQDPDPLTLSLEVAAFVVLAERTFRLALGALPRGLPVYRLPRASRNRVFLVVSVLGALFYAGYMARYTVYAHRRFHTYGADLGQYDALFINNLRGRWFR
jgi:hypothetical protein